MSQKKVKTRTQVIDRVSFLENIRPKDSSAEHPTIAGGCQYIKSSSQTDTLHRSNWWHEPHFNGLSDQAFELIKSHLSNTTNVYQMEDVICLQGDLIQGIGVILEGTVRIERYDVWGHRQILSILSNGHLFGEVFALLPHQPMTVSVVSASQPCRIAYLQLDELKHQLSSEDASQWMHNLLHIMVMRNLYLNQKMDVLSQRKTRDKLLRFLSQQVQAHVHANDEVSAQSIFSVSQTSSSQQGYLSEFHETEINLPFTRQELADHLCVERTAMTKTLMQLVDEGIIEVNGRTIRMKQMDDINRSPL